MNGSPKTSFLKPNSEKSKIDELKNMDLSWERVGPRWLPDGAKKVAAPPKTKSKLERKPTEVDINESAEAFIRKFKKQLVLQRLESIENYEQMLKRGT